MSTLYGNVYTFSYITVKQPNLFKGIVGGGILIREKNILGKVSYYDYIWNRFTFSLGFDNY